MNNHVQRTILIQRSPENTLLIKGTCYNIIYVIISYITFDYVLGSMNPIQVIIVQICQIHARNRK